VCTRVVCEHALRLDDDDFFEVISSSRRL